MAFFSFFCVKIKTPPLSFYLLKKKSPGEHFGALVFIKFASGDASTSHQHEEMKSPGDGFMEILTSALWELLAPPFPSSTPFISGNAYGVLLKLVYFPLRGPYCCQPHLRVCGQSFNALSWLAAWNTVHFCIKQLLSLSRQLRRALT